MTFTRKGMLPVTVLALHADLGALCEDTHGRTAFLSAHFFKGWQVAA